MLKKIRMWLPAVAIYSVGAIAPAIVIDLLTR
jgi:hypothetical protein